MSRIPAIVLFGVLTLTAAAKNPKVVWEEYEASMQADKGRQPIIILRWFCMELDGIYTEYPEIWKKGMTFGYGKRFKVTNLQGLDYDGKRQENREVVADILDTKTNRTLTFRSSLPVELHSYNDDWMKRHSEIISKKSSQEQKATNDSSRVDSVGPR